MPSQVQAEAAFVFCGGHQPEMWGGPSAQDEQDKENPLQIWDATAAHRNEAPVWRLLCLEPPGLEDKCGKRIQRAEAHRQGMGKGKGKRD